MIDAENTTMSARRRLEAALDRALADRDRYLKDHPDEDHLEEDHPNEDIDVAIEIERAIEDRIFARPPDTIGDLRLCAKALLARYEGFTYDEERADRLLKALVALPEPLWEERITPAASTEAAIKEGDHSAANSTST